MLVERLRDALCDAAVLLTADQERVQDPAAVVDRDVPQELDPSRVGVDLHHGDVRAEWEARRTLVEVELVREAGLHAFGELGRVARRSAVVRTVICPRQPWARGVRDRRLCRDDVLPGESLLARVVLDRHWVAGV